MGPIFAGIKSALSKLIVLVSGFAVTNGRQQWLRGIRGPYFLHPLNPGYCTAHLLMLCISNLSFPVTMHKGDFVSPLLEDIPMSRRHARSPPILGYCVESLMEVSKSASLLP
jgi:hypothetical protein